MPTPYRTLSWLGPPSASHSHRNPLSRLGLDQHSGAQAPDWNEELQAARDLPQGSMEERLQRDRALLQVDSWNPLTDTMPIHSWLHPWLPLLQSRLEPLYPPIRSKLANALQRWHPSDGSAASSLICGGYMQPGASENIAHHTHTERCKDFQYEALQERQDAESVASFSE
ncbi:tuftelin-interacting protein 11-like [Salmo trutta]|uniref:tuftelin-interacting protein 11-like n=1 Tax=Salmo trutta TaxID=8032 RepID=UPI001130938A|nr:tuftelin-interacting protein 11-like [Salmo trutta]